MNSSSDFRREVLDYILAKTDGALLAPIGLASKLIAGHHPQTVYKQIRHGAFALPTLRIGRHLYCRVSDLATLLAGGEIQQPAPGTPATEKRRRGRPLKYAQDQTTANVARARAVKAQRDIASTGAK